MTQESSTEDGPCALSIHESSIDENDTLRESHPEKQSSRDANSKKSNSQTTTANNSRQDQSRILSDDEVDILERQTLVPEINAGVGTLYRYASTKDMCIILVSCLMSIASGAAMPLMIVVFGNVQATLQDYFHGEATDAFVDKLNTVVLDFVYIAIGSFVASYTYTVGFIYTGEHISAKIREHYLEHCLRQNIAFFDQLGTGAIITRITADTNLIQDGISQKVGLTLAGISTFLAAFIIGFVKYWKLTLILLSMLVAIVLTMIGGSGFVMKYSKQSINAYAPGGSLADEAISSIRNTVAFGTQERIAKQYDAHLSKAESYGFRYKTVMGLIIAAMMLIMNLGYALAFWVGGQYVIYDGLSFQKVLVTVMAVVMASFSLGNVSSNSQAFSTALAAASKIFSTIDRSSPLDPFSDSGGKLEEVKGALRLENIKHVYPSRPDVVVMDGVSLVIPAGKTTALVGASGSGKSTVIGLVERFYNPVGGRVCLDDHDISTLNLRWLRQQISLVSQEPTLFGTSIFENINHGLIGTKYENESGEVRKERVIEAAKTANAHDFISNLPEGYDTNVGTRGFLLSGGQKQRIAIARAIVSNPRILLLDEATSALDTKSEGVVQAALDAASEGRTTIVVAHRLSTIKNAHKIVVMSKGAVVEQGTHDELLQNQGHYHGLVVAQEISSQMDEKEGTEMQSQTSCDRFIQLVAEKFSSNDDGAAHNGILDQLPNTSVSQSQTRHGHEEITSERGYSLWVVTKLIASFNREEVILLLIGLFFSIVSGGSTPVQAVLLAKSISTLSTPLYPSNLDKVKKDSDFWAAMWVLLAGVLGIAYAIHGVLFAKCSEKLLHRSRCSAFKSILRQDICFFDKRENSSGALTTFLSTKTTDLAGLSGVTLGNLLTVSTTLVAGIAVGVALGWKLALVCLSMVPILIACGYFRIWILSHFERRSKSAYADSASYASEAVSAIHTVASLTREREVLRHYREALASQQRASLPFVLKSSLLFAFSDSLTLLILALSFWYGGKLIIKGEYSMFQYFVCFASVIFSAQAAGAVFTYAGSMSKAYVAAQELKTLFDIKPTIDTWSKEGETIHDVEGHIEFRKVHFQYPTRPEQLILRGIDLDIRPGQYVALVGASGCGKSTIISLLERFYNPSKGGIYVDGKDVGSLNVNDYRSQIALVGQEPTLYQGTIKENILLGTSEENVSDDRLIRACMDANIYDFILSLPNGFGTTVGSKGVLLSGGQKQRVAIARALIRNPKVLLLDEATSALDSESERVVQEALDKAALGRTTIAVAHRLSTIQKADIIFVFDQGQVVERGTHGELIRHRGYYAELVRLQSLEEHT